MVKASSLLSLLFLLNVRKWAQTITITIKMHYTNTDIIGGSDLVMLGSTVGTGVP